MISRTEQETAADFVVEPQLWAYRLVVLALVAAVAILSSCLFFQDKLNKGTKEQAALLRNLNTVELRYCEQVQKVNARCEDTLVDVAAWLGLANENSRQTITAAFRNEDAETLQRIETRRELLAEIQKTRASMIKESGGVGGP